MNHAFERELSRYALEAAALSVLQQAQPSLDSHHEEPAASVFHPISGGRPLAALETGCVSSSALAGPAILHSEFVNVLLVALRGEVLCSPRHGRSQGRLHCGTQGRDVHMVCRHSAKLENTVC